MSGPQTRNEIETELKIENRPIGIAAALAMW